MSVGASKTMDVRLKSVLMATDFSAASYKALQHAVSIAHHFGAKLYLFHAVSSLGLKIAGPEAVATSTALAMRDASLLERKLIMSGALQGLRHQVVIREGEILFELQRVVRHENIDLIVLGTHGRTGISRLVMGSVAEQIFRSATCLVLTVGPHSPKEIDLEKRENAGPMIFATDFTNASLAALPYAISFANQRRARLVLLHMLDPVPHVEDNRWYTADDVVLIRKGAQLRALERLKQLTAGAKLELEPMCIAEYGEPAEGILCAANRLGAEVIVLGLHRNAHVATVSHLPWYTANKIVCRAAYPVLTVRASAEP